MEFNSFWDFFWVGAAGALALEVISLYKLRDRLGRLQEVLRNPYLWFVTLAMAAASGFFAWLVSSGTSGREVTPWQVFLSGTGADGLVRKALEKQQPPDRTESHQSDNKADPSNNDSDSSNQTTKLEKVKKFF